jgi:DNA polymerase (family 10)
MSLHNEDIAAAFDEMADLLAIQGENAFRIRAYRGAAQVVRSLARELAEMGGAKAFDALPGIGTDLAGKIEELLETGNIHALEKLRRQVPQGLRELLALPGLGPVRVRSLHTGLKVRGIEDLRHALADGRLAALRGFGPKIRSQLLAATAAKSSEPRRLAFSIATQYARPLKAYLERVAGVMQVEIAGSYRRGRDTVGDLDVVVCAREGATPIKALERYDDLQSLHAAGTTKASGVLRNGLQVDIRVLPPESFGAALHYLTGSRDHAIRVRRLAQKKRLKLSEYGLFRGAKRLAGATEEEVYAALGLPWIPPELRENRGEIEAAEHRALPRLIERTDLQGDLHAHTNASDGNDSLKKMAAAAQARGLRYLAITDHSKYLGITHGLDAGRLARQMDQVDKLNATLTGLTILKGAEVDILEDGSLALADAVLKRLDLVVIAVHSQFGLSEAKQTRRILRALERPYVSILAHPFGRLLGERAPYPLDFERVLSAANQRPCYLEINAQPKRLDLDDIHAKSARDGGALLSIASDAHSTAQFDYLDGGVRQARRGWVTKDDVLNARPLDELCGLLRNTMR